MASDAPREGNDHFSQQDCHLEIECDSGDYGDSLDVDDEEIIELTKNVKKTAQMDKPPPTRARKLNIRDTHVHDDYGGALLTEEERKLLGMRATLWPSV